MPVADSQTLLLSVTKWGTSKEQKRLLQTAALLLTYVMTSLNLRIPVRKGFQDSLHWWWTLQIPNNIGFFIVNSQFPVQHENCIGCSSFHLLLWQMDMLLQALSHLNKHLLWRHRKIVMCIFFIRSLAIVLTVAVVWVNVVPIHLSTLTKKKRG